VNHLLDFENIDVVKLEKLLDQILNINQNNLQPLDSFTLLKFDESSTRTRLSFSAAAQKLGIKVIETSNSISPNSKCESLKHEIETYKGIGIDVLVIRTRENNIDDYKMIKDLSVISAGFGTISHPTQALLDVATLLKFNLLNKEIPITYIGDLKHSRVFNLGKKLLNKLGYKVGVFTNEQLMPENLEGLHIFSNWNEVIEFSNSIELLRIQKERIENLNDIDFKSYISQYQLTSTILKNAKKELAILHPMPINVDIEISKEASEDPRFIYKEQLKLTVPTRITAYRYALGLE
jgi:aspartate carbamoyltransferase catalytic subunit